MGSLVYRLRQASSHVFDSQSRSSSTWLTLDSAADRDDMYPNVTYEFSSLDRARRHYGYVVADRTSRAYVGDMMASGGLYIRSGSDPLSHRCRSTILLDFGQAGRYLGVPTGL